MRAMNKSFVLFLTCTFLLGSMGWCEEKIMRKKLPEPKYRSAVSLEETLKNRRSVRNYSKTPISLDYVAQLLWSAQGMTTNWGGRTSPSAGALYPLEVYAITGNVENLSPGAYRYDPKVHEIIMIAEGDLRAKLASAALGQNSIREGAISLVFTAVYQRTTRRYGDRGIQYVHIETGHAGQNVCLQAEALGMGAVPIGAFNDDEVRRLLNLPRDERPLYIIPVGNK